jgi:hypothetical protein
MNTPRTGRVLALAILLVGLASPPLHAQIPGLGRVRDAVARNVLPDPTDLLEGEPPITTSLEDAVWESEPPPGFDENAVAPSPMAELERMPNGGFVLQHGFWEMHTQSYCLKAGTHGPGGGDGYLYAPPMGPAEEAVVAILHNAVDHPEIEQHRIQTLLWAIIARAKFEDLSAEHKATAARLLTPQQLSMLNRSALDLIPGPALDAALDRMPPLLRQIYEAEANLRHMLTQPGTTFEQMERVAVLAGMAPLGEGSRQVPSGRWSLHPDGYYVRYLPQGYSYTVVQIWVPQGSPAVGQEYDPALHIAVPGNTARQRLIQSGRFKTEG